MWTDEATEVGKNIFPMSEMLVTLAIYGAKPSAALHKFRAFCLALVVQGT